VQRPWEKVNHALVLGSLHHGIGKDSILEPVKRAIGPWNFQDISPTHLFGDFNPYVRSVLLRVNETKDLGETSRYELYERMKTLLASPPDVTRCNEKHIRHHYVLNVLGCIITTNHLADGLYLPPEDRRHYVAWSDAKPQDFRDNYWDEYWEWLNDGGDSHVADFLSSVDISGFNPKAPPPKTRAFWEIVGAARTGEENEMRDVIEALGDPAVVTIEEIKGKAGYDLERWLSEHKNRRAVVHRIESCGYITVLNPDAADGRWRIRDNKTVVYARRGLTFSDQVKAVRALQDRKVAEAAEEARKRAEAAEAKKPGSKPPKFK
jgi:Family of unknown function (DUF5906)